MKPHQVGALVVGGVLVVLCCIGVSIVSLVFG